MVSLQAHAHDREKNRVFFRVVIFATKAWGVLLYRSIEAVITIVATRYSAQLSVQGQRVFMILPNGSLATTSVRFFCFLIPVSAQPKVIHGAINVHGILSLRLFL